ncbi:MAG: PAS domain-containing protein, partial [Longimicrobiales bacterium]
MIENHSREQLLQHILGSMAIHVVAVNRRGRVTYSSPGRAEFAAFRGVAVSDLHRGADYLALLTEAAAGQDSYACAALEGFRSVLSRQTRSFSLEYPCDCATHSRWYLMRVDPLPARHGGAIVSHLDFTDQVLARQQLQESLERYELATLSGRIALWDWELKTGVFRVDPALKRLLGFGVNEIEDRIESWCERVHDDDRALYGAALEAHLRGETPSVEIEHRKIDANGNVRWFLSRGSLQRDADDLPVRMLGLDTDITDRKAAEQALIRETRRYHDIFAAAGVAIVEADYTPARQLVHCLLADGVTDLRGHLHAHPELVQSTMAAIRSVDANPQAVRLIGARTRQALLTHGYAAALIDGERHFAAQLLALADGCKEYTSEARLKTLQGEQRDIVLTVRFPASAGLRQTA